MAVGDDQVLRRDRGLVGDRQGLVEVGRVREAGQAQVERAGQVRHPAQGQGLAIDVGVDQRTGRGLADLQLHVVAAGHADGFHVPRHRIAVLGLAFATGAHREPVRRVGIGVGEAPGHVAIAAHDHRRQAGQGEAADVDPAAGRGRVRIAQPHPEPEVGGTQAQVHVVGDDGAAVGGQRGAHRPVVAAGAGRLVQRLAGGGRSWQPAQVDRRRVRQRGLATRLAQQRRVPLAAVVQQQLAQRCRQAPAQPPQRQLAAVLRVLQVEVHGVAGQGRVGWLPRPGRLAQQQVGPGSHRQCLQPGIDAFGVGLQLRHPRAGEGIQARFHAGAQPVDAAPAVGVQRPRAEQSGQFAGGGAAQQVHLEEALLRVHVAQGAGGVPGAGGVDGDDAEGIALHRGRRRQARQRHAALQARQAAAQQQPGGRGQGQQDQRQRAGRAQ